jgi:hypothetical protein
LLLDIVSSYTSSWRSSLTTLKLKDSSGLNAYGIYVSNISSHPLSINNV